MAPLNSSTTFRVMSDALLISFCLSPPAGLDGLLVLHRLRVSSRNLQTFFASSSNQERIVTGPGLALEERRLMALLRLVWSTLLPYLAPHTPGPVFQPSGPLSESSSVFELFSIAVCFTLCPLVFFHPPGFGVSSISRWLYLQASRTCSYRRPYGFIPSNLASVSPTEHSCDSPHSVALAFSPPFV